MPFGAELTEAGVRFRLWAPDAREVALCLHEADMPVRLPMQEQPGGWFERIEPRAAAGSRYAFSVDNGMEVPDPASRANPDDVHAPSEVIDPLAFDWSDGDWPGRPLAEAVFYELHVGTFSARGDFAGVERHLDHLVELGVTAVELMPVADFPGRRGWGYDGVLPFAPEAAYGRPDDLKRLVQAAHTRGLMVFLDVVYNHFGPEGNYLHVYAKPFFDESQHTPWGAALDFRGAGSRAVRDYFIHNALYWLTEFRLDGLRLDAVHAILDPGSPGFLEELAAAVRAGPGVERQVHLVLENDDNRVSLLEHREGRPLHYDAQWNDDLHHALHVSVSGETDGYYRDYAERPLAHLGRCLAEGFAYQGEPSAHRDGRHRGEPSASLPLTAFVGFLQNHDQVGNRAFGERIGHLLTPPQLRAAVSLLLLAPQPPLLFMGEEFGAAQPFLFFCDFGPELAEAVTRGRREEFARFERFRDPDVRKRIPDPCAPDTFERCRLDWSALEQPEHAQLLRHYRELLALRVREIVPRLAGATGAGACWHLLGERALVVQWTLGDDSRLQVSANLGEQALALEESPAGRRLYASEGVPRDVASLPRWSVMWTLEEGSPGE